MTGESQSETWTLALVVLGAIVLFPLLLGGGGMMGAGGFGMLGGGMFLTPLILIALIVYLVSDYGSRTGSTASSDALDTLRERYARGELTDEEFKTRLRTLQNDE